MSEATEIVSIAQTSWRYATQPDGKGELSDLDLRIHRGEVVLLCGPSGCGKTSVLKLINGLIPHFHDGELTGAVDVAGTSVPVTPIDQQGLRTATVFQNPRTQFFTGHVASEIAFALENAGRPAEEIRQRVSAAAAELDLLDLLDRELDSLSGGQQQLVACAVARAIDPDVYLFDEPTSNLSANAIGRIGELIRTLKSEGRTIVIAEHRLYFLRDVADRVLVLHGGRIAAEHAGTDFWQLPTDLRNEMGLRSLDRPTQHTTRQPTAARRDTDDAPRAGSGLHLENVRYGYRHHSVLDIDRMEFSRRDD